MPTYEEYLESKKALTFEEMLKIHHEMLAEIGNDEDANDIYGEVMDAAIKYAHMRAEWSRWNQEKKMDQDELRTGMHNSLIIKLNMLARFLKMQGMDAAWRDTLGYEEDDPYNRKRIGDFGCFLAFINSINAR